VTGYLLDTSAVLLLGFEGETIPHRLKALVGAERRFISHVCAMEMAIKQSIGKLRLPPSFETSFSHGFQQTVGELSAEILPIDLNHIDMLSRLPLNHRDPFDRILVSQALCEDLTIVSRDRALRTYPGLNVLEI
jgi:PIN domain nuclease of toxin-antitoxin system